MSGNARIFANLKENFNQYDLLYMEPLSYIRALIGDAIDANKPPKIMLLCKKKAAPGYSLPSHRPKIKYEAERTFELMGTPLEDSCTMDEFDESIASIEFSNNFWSNEEEQFLGIPLDIAQQTLSKMGTTIQTEETCPLWALCAKNDKNQLLSFNIINSKWFQRGFVTFDGLIEYNDVKMKTLTEKHFSYTNMMGEQLNVTIDTYFNLHENNIVLQVSRSKSSKTMQNFLVDNTIYDRLILHQSIRIGDRESVAMEFWMQLEILDTIKKSIVLYRESEDPDDLVYQVATSRDMKWSDIQEQIYELLTNGPPIYTYHDDNEKEDINDIEATVTRANQRRETEITDQLWTVLKWCSSYGDLQLAFKYLFNCVVKHNIVNMPTSENHLAVLMRDISNRRIAIPQLKGSEPLELLVEIGLEKISKDYEFIFNESKLINKNEFTVLTENVNKSPEGPVVNLNVRKSLAKLTMNDSNKATGNSKSPLVFQRKTLMHNVKPNQVNVEEIGFQNSVFNLQNIEHKLGKLGQLHLLLEHILLIRTNLDMDNLYPRQSIARDLLQPVIPFHILAAKKIDARQIAISNESILAKIEKELPQRQRITMSSENALTRVKNIFYFTAAPIFPPDAFFPCMQFDDLMQAGQYFAHHLLDIASPKINKVF